MKLWVDDIRKMPSWYDVWAKTADQAIAVLSVLKTGKVTHISLDHDLGDGKKAFAALSAFMGITVTDGKYPVCGYSASEENGEISLKVKSSPELLVNAILWSSVSKDQDFRDETWVDSLLNPADKTDIRVKIKKPGSGYKAFYVDLQYKAPFGEDYTQSTRMFVTDSLNLLLKAD